MLSLNSPGVFLGGHEDVLSGNKSQSRQTFLLDALLEHHGYRSAQLVIEEPEGVVLRKCSWCSVNHKCNMSNLFNVRIE